MLYWEQSPQNPSGLTEDDIAQEIRYQKSVCNNTSAAEGEVVPHYVHSSRGRFEQLSYLHTLSKYQFKNTIVVAGANVVMLERMLDEERRDRLTDLDWLMKRETEDTIVWLGQNLAFRQGVESATPIVIPWGPSIATTLPPAEAYQISGGPNQSPATVPWENQPPAVEPWDNMGPPLPDGPPPETSGARSSSPPPPPPPPASMAPIESQRLEPPPPPPVEGTARRRSQSVKNKMPKEQETGGVLSSGGRWTRQSEDRTGFGATQASPGRLTLPPVNPAPLHTIPAILRETPNDPTDGEGIVSVNLTKIKKEPGPGEGPGRSKLRHVYDNCANSCPAKRNHDEYGLEVPQLCGEDRPGIKKSFESQDVRRCYVRGFTDWEDFEDRYGPWKKVKQATDKSQFWDRPPGALSQAVRLDTHWTSKEMGRGREYVVKEKCWCTYPKPDGEVNMGLWVCLELDPKDVEPTSDEPPPVMGDAEGSGEGVEDTPAVNSIVPGDGLVCQKNVGWVNAIALDLLKLSRGDRNFLFCSWIGFDKEYYINAQNRGERTPQFRTLFNMQLVSDAYLLSQPGLSLQGSKGELQMAFSSDKAATPRDESTAEVRETITPGGGVTRWA